jgi:hypothetical protein
METLLVVELCPHGIIGLRRFSTSPVVRATEDDT